MDRNLRGSSRQSLKAAGGLRIVCPIPIAFVNRQGKPSSAPLRQLPTKTHQLNINNREGIPRAVIGAR